MINGGFSSFIFDHDCNSNATIFQTSNPGSFVGIRNLTLKKSSPSVSLVKELSHKEFDKRCIVSFLAPKTEVLRIEIKVLRDFQARGYSTIDKIPIPQMIAEREHQIQRLRSN